MKRKLAVDARMVAHSGIGTYLRNLLPRLADEGSFDLIALGDADTIAKASGLRGIPVIRMESGIYGVKEQIELARKAPACDLFWSPHYNVPVLPIRARKRLVTIHDVNHLANAALLSVPQLIYAKAMFNAATRLSHAIITDSHFSKDEIVRYLGTDPAKIESIYLGVPDDFADSKGGRPLATPYVLFVGNVKPHKNLKNALLAFARMRSGYPDLKFVIVGKREGFITSDRELSEAMEGMPEGSVEFTGFVSDGKLKDYYAHAALFLFPSFYEGFGLPVLEAMTFGIPIASSRNASLPEIGGDRVEYFDPADPDGMAAAMRKGLADWRTPRKIDYSSHLAKFRWKDSLDRHLEVFRRLAPA